VQSSNSKNQMRGLVSSVAPPEKNGNLFGFGDDSYDPIV
jgi:hypothetical protein